MTDASGVGEGRRITLKDPQGEWPATLEAFSGRHMRIALAPGSDAPKVRWGSGAEVRVCLEGPSGSFCAPASVVKQIGSVVWLAVSPSVSGLERRSAPRVSVRFPVCCVCRGVEHSAWCLDLSAGGMRLSLSTHVAEGDDLSLAFSLPDAPEPLTLHGRILWVAPGPRGRTEAGVKFVGLHPAQGAAIAAFCARRADPLAV
ncbi:MAG: PilZ domain-containing protein [Chthonomonadales bacterium]